MPRLALWWQAARPHTLLLSLGSVLLGNSLSPSAPFSLTTLSLSLLCAALLQTLSNLANDYGDRITGVDHHRSAPSRAISTGVISASQAKVALILISLTVLLCGAALVFTAPLSWWTQILFLALGGLALTAALTYTLGRRPYGYRALGDLSVFIFFGLMGVLGSQYLQTQQLSATHLLPASAVGLLCCGVLNINNIRDITTDQAAGKITLASILGHRGALNYFRGCWCGALLLAITYSVTSGHFGALGVLPLAYFWLRLDTGLRQSRTYAQYSQCLANMVKLTLCYEVLFLLGVFATRGATGIKPLFAIG